MSSSRRLRLAAAGSVVALAFAVAACSGSEAAQWTYVPASPATPVPSAGASAAASPSASAAASAGASAGASSAPSSAAGPTVDLAAQNIAYDKASMQAPANQAFTIHFSNNDAGVPHNVQIKDASGSVLFDGQIVNGVTTVDYSIPPLQAGTYQFVCKVHPNMVGTLTVAP